MLRSLLRGGLVAVFVLSLAAPAQAVPLAGERERLTSSLSALWELLVSPIVAIWTGGGPATGGGPGACGGPTTTQSGGACDPNG